MASGLVSLGVHVRAVGQVPGEPVARQPVTHADEGKSVLLAATAPSRASTCVRRPPPACEPRGRACPTMRYFGSGVASSTASIRRSALSSISEIRCSLRSIVSTAFDDDQRRRPVGQLPVTALQGIDVVAAREAAGHKSGATSAAEARRRSRGCPRASRGQLSEGSDWESPISTAVVLNVSDDDFVPAVRRIQEKRARGQVVWCCGRFPACGACGHRFVRGQPLRLREVPSRAPRPWLVPRDSRAGVQPPRNRPAASHGCGGSGPSPGHCASRPPWFC